MAWEPPEVTSSNSNWQPPEVAASQSQNGSSNWDVAKFAYNQASQMAPWNKANQAWKAGVGNVAEFVGKHTNLDPTQIGAALTPVAIAPEALASYTSLQGLYNSPNPIAQGITKTPQQIGQQMNAGEEAAGISGQLPVRSGMQPRFPKTPQDVMTVTPEGTAIPGGTPMNTVAGVSPTAYPKNTNALLNFMKQRIDQYGDKLPVQELADYKRMLPEMFSKMEVARGTPQYALASQLQNQVSSLHSAAIPGREALNQAYGISKTLHPDVANWIANYVQKYGKSALKGAIEVALGGAVASRFFK